MTKKYRMIQVGTGGQGNGWCSRFLPPNIADGRIEPVAAVDVNPDVLINAQQHLGLPPEKCYTDIERAFDENPADFCTVVVPPAFHESVVDVALAHDMHIISEKPIADTLEGSVRIAAKVKRAGKKMGVTMSHRFDQDKTTLRRELRSGRAGTIDYIICRFTCGLRNFGDWGAHFRHTMEETLMIEGSVHHLDIIADLADSKCDTIYAQTWNPTWGEYNTGSQGHVMMTFENGTRAFYEGAKTNASGFNGWSQEYFRAECENETLIMDCRRIERFPYQPRQYSREGQGEEVQLMEQSKWRNEWLIAQFLDWLDGGPPMETNVEANLQSVALIFAAIESSHTGQPVKVQEFLRQAQEEEERSHSA